MSSSAPAGLGAASAASAAAAAARFDAGYIRTLDAGLKLGVIISSLIGCICSSISYNTAHGFYEFHASLAIICSTFLFLFYAFRLVYRLKISWNVIEVLLSWRVFRCLVILVAETHFFKYKRL